MGEWAYLAERLRLAGHLAAIGGDDEWNDQLLAAGVIEELEAKIERLESSASPTLAPRPHSVQTDEKDAS